MNKIMMRFSQAICLMAVAMCFTLTSCEESEQNEDGLPYYNKFVDINITRCERVGSVLMVDFTVTNKQNKMLGVTLKNQTIEDNTGKKYSALVWGSGHWGHTAIAIADNEFYDTSYFKINSKGIITGHLKVYEFDPNDKAKNVNIQMYVGIDNETLAEKLFERTKVGVVDNRVKAHGIQTNDSRLDYKLTSCAFNKNWVEINFTVTNKTDGLVEEFEIGSTSSSMPEPFEAYDNLGNVYNANSDGCFRIANSDWRNRRSTTIEANNTIDCALRIPNVRANASDISASFRIEAKNMVFEDEVLRFITIPIEKVEAPK